MRASTSIRGCVRPLVHPSVGPLVRPSVGPSRFRKNRWKWRYAVMQLCSYALCSARRILCRVYGLVFWDGRYYRALPLRWPPALRQRKFRFFSDDIFKALDMCMDPIHNVSWQSGPIWPKKRTRMAQKTGQNRPKLLFFSNCSHNSDSM